jgi:hypothetical protein
MRTILASVVVLFVIASAVPAYAQSDLGSLRGYVKDEQGGVLPGVTVTAIGPQILAPVVSVTDGAGYYRLLNLPPGTVTLTAELPGFATYRQEGIVVRAGSTFSIDIAMKVGTLQESVTVKAESPMVETIKASTSFVISGELMRAAPVTSRGIYTDAVDMVPGVGSRQANDGSGIRIYYFMGTNQLGGSYMALEGAQFGGYANPAPARTSMSVETIADTELRTGGADASTPLATGLYLNVVAPQGGNNLKGSAGFTLQPLAWNSDNSSGGRVSGGLPKPEGVQQVDLSLGGPVKRDKVWFFSSFRWANDTNGISRTPLNLTQLTAFRASFQPFNNTWRTKNPFVKVTTQLNPNHVLSAYYLYDRSYYTSHREYDEDPIVFQSGGGSLAQARLNSLWGKHFTSQFAVAYNDKHNAGEDTYKDLESFTGPQIQVHQDIFMSSGIPTGTGMLVQMGNTQSKSLVPSSAVYLQGDVTYFNEGFLGAHEIKAGVWAAPRSHYDVTNQYVNGGFILQEVRQIDTSNPAAGTTPFRNRYMSPATIHTTAARDRDIGIYLQDGWRPSSRLTATIGVRVDFIRRWDDIMSVQRMKSTEVGPRVGVSYLLTKDAKNVLRFFAGRIHDQMAGSDVVDSFATTSPVTTTDVYIDKNGNKTTVITPPPTAALAARQISPDLHQPFIEEYLAGFRRQFPGQLSLDVSGRRRTFKDMYSLVDINGIYPNGPYQPFGGFGLVDPNRGILYQERNATWNSEVLTALEVVIAKNMSRNIQAMFSFSRQWQHMEGTWAPTDPARFIQPDAFPDNRLLPATGGNADYNNLDASTSTFAGFRPYTVRLVGQYLAPWGITLAGSYEVSSGDYTGTMFTRLSAADSRFGPARVTLANGTTQPNPLATTIRFAFATRGDGQVLNEAVKAMQLKIGKEFRLGRSNRVTASLNIYNLLNSGSNTQYATGANLLYSPYYLSAYNRLPARAFQLMVVDRF